MGGQAATHRLHTILWRGKSNQFLEGFHGRVHENALELGVGACGNADSDDRGSPLVLPDLGARVTPGRVFYLKLDILRLNLRWAAPLPRCAKRWMSD